MTQTQSFDVCISNATLFTNKANKYRVTVDREDPLIHFAVIFYSPKVGGTISKSPLQNWKWGVCPPVYQSKITLMLKTDLVYG